MYIGAFETQHGVILIAETRKKNEADRIGLIDGLVRPQLRIQAEIRVTGKSKIVGVCFVKFF